VEWHPPQFATFGDSYDFEDGDTAAYLNAILADPNALNALDAIDMQSYGRGLTNREYQLARENGKELWVSLSATDGLNNNMNDPILGPISAGNILSNLNHGVSLWHHWLMSDLTNNDGGFKLRFKYIANISKNIKPGARMRQCTSDNPDLPSPDMRWNFNLREDGGIEPWQPDIIAAAGENPDESWFISIVNLSGIHSQHKASVYAGTPKSYHVTITSEELSNYRVLFNVSKCTAVAGILPAGVDTMLAGSLELIVNSEESLVLRSFEKTEITSSIGSIRNMEGWLRVYPNPAYDLLTIDLPGYNGTFNVSVYDLTGKLWQSGRISSGETIDVSRIPEGTYILSIRDDANNLYRQKLILQSK